MPLFFAYHIVKAKKVSGNGYLLANSKKIHTVAIIAEGTGEIFPAMFTCM